MGDGRYVILDGANRPFALGTLGYTYILVQVVDYESNEVQLETWHHIVSGMSWFKFLRNICQLDSLDVACDDLLSARAALARRDVLAYTVLGDGNCYTLKSNAVTLAERTRILQQIVDTYKSRVVLNRISTDPIGDARRIY